MMQSPQIPPDSLRLPSFDYDPRTRVVFGPGSIERLGDICRDLGGERILLVTDRGLRAAGHLDRAESILRKSGMGVIHYDQVEPNPTTDDVERCLAVARDEQINLIVGLGGGSSMDCAKGTNFLLTNGGKMEDYWGVGKAHRPMLPMVAIPTTAGTGSEAQSFAIISRSSDHVKMACGDKKAACRVAILDPELTLSMPRAVAAATGIDALSHALETSVTTKRNPISDLFSRQAWKLLSRSFSTVLEQGNNLEARASMLVGAHLAGAAIENSMLGATHACANPLSARFHLTHGVAIGIMLPHVIRYNSEVAGKQYARLAFEAGLCREEDPQAVEVLARFISELVRDSGQPTTLSEFGVNPDAIPQLAADADQQWTGKFNPRPLSTSIFEELFRCAL